jgi:hypothetical protein
MKFKVKKLASFAFAALITSTSLLSLGSVCYAHGKAHIHPNVAASGNIGCWTLTIEVDGAPGTGIVVTLTPAFANPATPGFPGARGLTHSSYGDPVILFDDRNRLPLHPATGEPDGRREQAYDGVRVVASPIGQGMKIMEDLPGCDDRLGATTWVVGISTLVPGAPQTTLLSDANSGDVFILPYYGHTAGLPGFRLTTPGGSPTTPDCVLTF